MTELYLVPPRRVRLVGEPAAPPAAQELLWWLIASAPDLTAEDADALFPLGAPPEAGA